MHRTLVQIFDETSGTDALRRVVDLIRPAPKASPAEIDARIDGLTETLAADPDLLTSFDIAVVEVLAESKLAHAFAESGILEMRGFFGEFTSRTIRRILPRQHAEDAARRRILEIFDADDWRWVTGGSLESWIRLFELLADHHHWHPPRDQVAESMAILAQRIGALGVDEQFQAKTAAIADTDADQTLFIDLTAHTHDYLRSDGDSLDDSFDRLQAAIDACRRTVTALREHKDTVGTNLRLTRATRRLLQQLNRLELLAHLLHPSKGLDSVTCAARLVRTLVESELTATSLGRLVRKSTDLLAHQVAEQGARKGQKYITDTSRGYWHFLRAALQGGAIVAPFAIIKILLVQQSLSLGAQALLFSINYAVCFTLLYVTGSILATKQPAVTASAIARKIDEASTGDEAVEGVADVVVLVWRSQFISFVGNMAAALPIGFFIAWAAVHWLGVPLTDSAGAEYLVDGVHPYASGALAYAAIAGVCLFLSGIIGGAVDNHLLYGEVKRRISDHPGLAFLGDRREAIASFVDKHLGSITGNVVLGFMLGTAGPLGVILGLPFDIRHIAFSSAEVGVAAQTLPAIMSSTIGLIAFAGVVGIGFFNFLICFLLTMGAGLDARGLTFVEVRQLVPMLLKRAVTRPWEWFVPTRRPSYELPRGIPKPE